MQIRCCKGIATEFVLSLLFNSILFNGYSPRELLLSTIVSIPKDVKSSLSSADNYRGISLFNSIAKVFDYVIIELFGGSLQTTDMQFANKAKHSITLCTIVYIETLHHYVNNGSNVYGGLLDASKAFDRIHYGKHFTILLSKQVPAFINHYLLASYIRAKCQYFVGHMLLCLFYNVYRGKTGGGGVICNTAYHLY